MNAGDLTVTVEKSYFQFLVSTRHVYNITSLIIVPSIKHHSKKNQKPKIS